MRHSVSPLQKVLEWPRSDAYILKKRWHLYKIWAEVLALCAQPVRRHREFRYRCVSSHIFGRKQTLSSSKNSVSHGICLTIPVLQSLLVSASPTLPFASWKDSNHCLHRTVMIAPSVHTHLAQIPTYTQCLVSEKKWKKIYVTINYIQYVHTALSVSLPPLLWRPLKNHKFTPTHWPGSVCAAGELAREFTRMY